MSKADKYDKAFVNENMMGPNSLVILEELLQGIELKPNMRVLDLGCGRGLTSIYLAKEYGVTVYAVDLWITATENNERVKLFGLEDKIIPIHANALELPFAEGYFDAVVSVDSYHYFGNNETYFIEKLKPLLKPEAIVTIAFPSMKKDVLSNTPEEMKPYWDKEALEMWQYKDWWCKIFGADFDVKELFCFDKAWEDWLTSGNPYVEGDDEMMAMDNGRYMNLLGITNAFAKRRCGEE